MPTYIISKEVDRFLREMVREDKVPGGKYVPMGQIMPLEVTRDLAGLSSTVPPTIICAEFDKNTVRIKIWTDTHTFEYSDIEALPFGLGMREFTASKVAKKHQGD